MIELGVLEWQLLRAVIRSELKRLKYNRDNQNRRNGRADSGRRSYRTAKLEEIEKLITELLGG